MPTVSRHRSGTRSISVCYCCFSTLACCQKEATAYSTGIPGFGWPGTQWRGYLRGVPSWRWAFLFSFLLFLRVCTFYPSTSWFLSRRPCLPSTLAHSASCGFADQTCLPQGTGRYKGQACTSIGTTYCEHLVSLKGHRSTYWAHSKTCTSLYWNCYSECLWGRRREPGYSIAYLQRSLQTSTLAFPCLRLLSCQIPGSPPPSCREQQQSAFRS